MFVSLSFAGEIPPSSRPFGSGGHETPVACRRGCRHAAFSMVTDSEPERLMRRFSLALLCAALVALVGLGVSGCNSDSGTGGKMETQKMSSEKMSADKMDSGKMDSGKMGSEKMDSDKMGSKMGTDKMGTDKMGDGK
jgi:hypothetical protein